MPHGQRALVSPYTSCLGVNALRVAACRGRVAGHLQDECTRVLLQLRAAHKGAFRVGPTSLAGGPPAERWPPVPCRRPSRNSSLQAQPRPATKARFQCCCVAQSRLCSSSHAPSCGTTFSLGAANRGLRFASVIPCAAGLSIALPDSAAVVARCSSLTDSKPQAASTCQASLSLHWHAACLAHQWRALRTASAYALRYLLL